jgi:hypothetical protein
VPLFVSNEEAMSKRKAKLDRQREKGSFQLSNENERKQIAEAFAITIRFEHDSFA